MFNRKREPARTAYTVGATGGGQYVVVVDETGRPIQVRYVEGPPAPPEPPKRFFDDHVHTRATPDGPCRICGAPGWNPGPWNPGPPTPPLAAPVVDQPAPIPNDRPAVWDLVIEDMRERDHLGRERYGTPLQAGNGRDALVDLYQELLDACCYIRQVIEERGESA